MQFPEGWEDSPFKNLMSQVNFSFWQLKFNPFFWLFFCLENQSKNTQELLLLATYALAMFNFYPSPRLKGKQCRRIDQIVLEFLHSFTLGTPLNTRTFRRCFNLFAGRFIYYGHYQKVNKALLLTTAMAQQGQGLFGVGSKLYTPSTIII